MFADDIADDKDGTNLRNELGLTVERSNELVEITQSIMKQSSRKGYGRTSHVLLGIAGKKDLSDVEKVACAFIFAHKTRFGPVRQAHIGEHDKRLMDESNIADPDLSAHHPIDISGIVVVPQGVDIQELTSVVMATLMSLIRQMPKYEAQNFCRRASVSFAKMAFTGDMKL